MCASSLTWQALKSSPRINGVPGRGAYRPPPQELPYIFFADFDNVTVVIGHFLVTKLV